MVFPPIVHHDLPAVHARLLYVETYIKMLLSSSLDTDTGMVSLALRLMCGLYTTLHYS